MSITIPKEYEEMFGKQDFVIIPKSLYACLPRFVKSKNPKKIDSIFNRATKSLKTKEVKSISAVI
jgi:hypothetical protein